jgi:outer membrane receptor protein involved in Fe transport
VYKFDLNTLQRRSLRANVRSQLTDKFDLALNTGYSNSDVRLPRNDNEATGITSAALLSTRVFYDSINQGYGFSVTPRELSAINARENVNRLTGSLTANYRPLSWLSLSGQAGLDAVDRAEAQLIPPGFVRNSAANLEGSRSVFRNRGTAYTANGNATANFGLGERLTGSTSAGVQYNEDVVRGTTAFGAVILPGTGSLEGTNARFAVSEQNFHVRTIGGYLQQQVALNDRLFVTGAVRADRNSAFGRDFGFVYYPSITTSWVVYEEPWFPEISALSSLRLRAAYGTSGLRPGVTDAFTFFTPVTASSGAANVAAFTPGGTGNTALRPEKSSEVEFGFDAGMFGDRIGLDVTYFDKTANDALVAVRLAPSLGLTTTRRLNLGSVSNKGLEMQLNTRIVERGNVRWDAIITHTRLKNELETLGDAVAPIQFGLGGNSQRHTPGRPLGSYFAQPYTFEDKNSDGIITPSEIVVGDTAEYMGSPFPTREASFQSNLQVGIFRLSGLLDYRGGFQQFNSTAEFRCGFQNCQQLYDPATSLADQARAVATLFYDTPAGYMEDGDFVKLRELSLTAGLPSGLAQRFGARAFSVTLAGRNLKTWTDYTGFDPEINFAGTSSNFSTAEFLTQPPARTVTLRLDANF